MITPFQPLIWLTFLLSFSSCINGQQTKSQEQAAYNLSDISATNKYSFVNQNKLSIDLKEVSGLVCGRNNPDLVYMIEDKGGKNEVYVFAKNGDYKTKFIISGVANIDWEDLAIGVGPEEGKNYVYIADIGDNDAERDHVRIIRFEEPNLTKEIKSSYVIGQADILKIRYPGGAKDAETLLVDPFTKQLYIISKREETAVVYSASNNRENDKIQEAKTIGILPMKKIVGGDISADGKQIVLKNKKQVFYWENNGKAINKTMLTVAPKTISAYIEEPQGESIGFDYDAKCFFTITETKKIKNAKPILYRYVN
jgi:hypothetical protein